MEKTENSNTTPWNVAGGYSHLKLLKWLIEIDDLEIIALHGSATMDISYLLSQDENTLNYFKIQALKRLKDVLRLIISNSKFAIKKKSDSEKIEELKKRLDNLDTNEIFDNEEDQVSNTKFIKINENFYDVLKELRDIKEEVLEPLNNNKLIFRISEEEDFESLKQEFVEGG